MNYFIGCWTSKDKFKETLSARSDYEYTDTNLRRLYECRMSVKGKGCQMLNIFVVVFILKLS